MGKTNFQSLKELTTSLAEKLDLLADGKLKLNEIEVITEQAREIYERLVIIRFKSYEAKDMVTEVADKSEEAPKKPKAEEKEFESEEEDLMMFDFTGVGDEADISNEIIAETEAEIDKERKKSALSKPDTTDSSLNDNYKKSNSSVGGNFEKAPISDLKEHIGINRKFLYVNDLFAGDSNLYNLSIGKLNSCASKEDAFKHVKKLTIDQKWDNENPTVLGFIELVERRYLT